MSDKSDGPRSGYTVYRDPGGLWVLARRLHTLNGPVNEPISLFRTEGDAEKKCRELCDADAEADYYGRRREQQRQYQLRKRAAKGG